MKMKKILFSGLVGLSLVSTFAFAQENAQVIQNKIQKEFPKLNVAKVTYLPEVKLYEIRVKDNKVLSYTNQSLDYFILNGKIIDPKNKTDISTERDMIVVKDIFNSLPFNKSINVKYGDGKSKVRRVAVFSDPDCPFCKKTDQEIESQMKGDNIVFSYFMNPLEIAGHEQAPLKARKIWCSPDKVASWKNWMLNGVLPNNPGTCANPVNDTKKLADELGFTATPTFMFDNGFIFRGSASPEQIRELLNTKAP